MVAPASVKNTVAQSVDTLYDAAGAGRLKLAVGAVSAGLSAPVSWQGVATHVDGDTFGASGGVVVGAGVDLIDGVTIRRQVTDPQGRSVAVAVPSSGVLTNHGGSITAGGAAQTLAAVNLNRRYLLVQNVHPTEDLWINFTTAAVRDQPSIRIVAGAAFLMDGLFVSTELVSVTALTTGHKFSAKEG